MIGGEALRALFMYAFYFFSAIFCHILIRPAAKVLITLPFSYSTIMINK